MKVLIVGGGLAGTATATALRKKDKTLEIVIVEPKDYIEVYWASYRALFDAKVAQDSTFSMSQWAERHDVQWLPSIVTNLTDTQAKLANGQVVDDFDVAVICTGAVNRWSALGRRPVVPPSTSNGASDGRRSKSDTITASRQERLQELEQVGRKLLEEQSIVVVGGGLVGVETAGDLAYFASKHNKPLQVTLVHSGDRLVPEFPKRPAEQTHRKLTSLGVKVVLGDKVVQVHRKDSNNKNGTATTKTSFKLQKANEPITARKIIWTTGISPQNGTFLASQYLDGKGWIKVDDYFRLLSDGNPQNRLFALGDCCDLFPKAGSQILGAMHMIAQNIKVALDHQGSPDIIQKKIKRALGKPEIYIATIGKKDGVAVTPVVNTQFILPGIKNSTMFLFKPKKDLGITKD